MEKIKIWVESLGIENAVLNQTFASNTVFEWALAGVLFIILLFVFKVFQGLVLMKLKKMAQKTKTDIDDTFISIIKTIKPPFYIFVSFYLAIRSLTIPSLIQQIIDIILIFWLVWQAVLAVQIVLDYAFRKGIGKEEDPGTKSALRMLNAIAKGVLWALGGLFILSNLGVNITSLIAGLGIGGIAIALAIQNILSDLFSSFAIYFDKPFVVGDFIIVGKEMGTVEKVGIKTTRLRALQGEEVVISNKELTSVRIQNFKRMEDRRTVFNIGVTYQTPTEKIKKIPGIIKDIVESVEKTRFDRVHFNKFGDSALLFEVVYYTLSSDYSVYMDVLQEVNLKIKEKFEEEEIEMAYPTQTVYIEK